MNALRRLSDGISTMSSLLRGRPPALEKPRVLQLPVNDVCNSRCRMCRIWERQNSGDLTTEQLGAGLRSPLFSEVRGVGISGGEPTLRTDLGPLVEVLFDTLPKLRHISLITNGYQADKVIQRIAEVGAITHRRAGALDVMVSLDGYGEVHDRVRGRPGNFASAQRVTDFARSSPLVDTLRIGCTIIRENVYGLHDLLDDCQRQDLYIKYRLGIPHQRLYTENLLDAYALSVEEKVHVAEFLEGLILHYEQQEQQRFFYRSLIDQLLFDAPRRAGCDWQHRGATITSRGELLYCAVQSRPLGFIDRDDSMQAYFGNEDHLREIIATKCDRCRHDYVGLPPRRELARQLAVGILKRSGVLPYLRGGRLHAAVGRWRADRTFTRRSRWQPPESDRPTSPRTFPPGARKVLVCGWYGTETLGDKAILGGIIRSVREVLGDVHFTIVSLHPYVTRMTRYQMPELTGAHVVAPDEGMHLAKTMDLVIFGGGPLMAIQEIAEMEALFRVARWHRVPTFLAGCGVGPLGSETMNRGIRRLLDLADLRIYRDDRSRQIANELGITTHGDAVAEDPAFTWLRAVRATLPTPRRADRRVLLLGLRDFPHRQYAGHQSESQRVATARRYEAQVLEALEILAAWDPDLVIRPLPMCTNHFGGDDRWFYRRLFLDAEPLRTRIDRSLLGAELAPVDYCRAFLDADAVLAMRYHSLVFALGLGLRSVAIDYTLGRGKVAALAERFQVPGMSLDCITSGFLAAALREALEGPGSTTAGHGPSFGLELGKRLPSLLERYDA